MSRIPFTRRSFLEAAAAAPLARALRAATPVPVGLELYSVRNELAKDLPGTVRAVGAMGYQVVEFYAPYYQWTAAYAREVRKVLDGSGLVCNSTHNSIASFTPEGIRKAIDLNQILGARYIILASAPQMNTLDDWKGLGERLTQTAETLRPLKMSAGYHNHELEFTPIQDKLPMQIIAANTPHDFVLQLDVGTCVAAGADAVAWIKSQPGRIRSMHCKDWLPGKGYTVLLGDGAAPWQQIFDAAESVGGIEYYLIEQEGSQYSEMETAKRCLANWHLMRPTF
jgi:sugar phosphate isomerase/epimerase